LTTKFTAPQSRALVDAQCRETLETLRFAHRHWKAKISAEQEAAGRRMNELLERQAKQIQGFQAEFGVTRFLPTTRQHVDAVNDSADSSIFKARPIRLLTQVTKIDRLPVDVPFKRKRLIDKHKMETCALNAECEKKIAGVEERRGSAIGMKKSAVERLKTELCAMGGIEAVRAPMASLRCPDIRRRSSREGSSDSGRRPSRSSTCGERSFGDRLCEYISDARWHFPSTV
jgi:hypothetical protein